MTVAPLTWANGPSLSGTTRSRGSFLASALPDAELNAAGPTLNQHPISEADLSSAAVPVNQ